MCKNKQFLVPAAPGKCPVCAVEHAPEDPHNKDSLHYQYRFYGLNQRWPTWADALAHCDDKTRELWKQGLIKNDAWSEPETGEPIADDPTLVEPGLLQPVNIMKVEKINIKTVREAK